MKSYSSLAEALAATDPRVERPFRCHVHDDHEASASVNVAKRMFYCYACGAKGKLDAASYYTEPELNLTEILALLEERPIMPTSLLDLYTAYEHPYWSSRFTPEAIAHFQLGYDPVKERPCYPMFDPAGRLLGMVYRNLDHDGPKYRYPYGVQKSHLIYNFSAERRDTVILCEGAMDVIACWEAGYEAFGIYGATLHPAQVQLIARCGATRAILAFDNDSAGRRGAAEAERVLRGFTIDQLDLGDHKDVAEIPRHARKTLLDSLAIS